MTEEGERPELPVPPPTQGTPLTADEVRVLRLVAEGRETQAIAATLGVSPAAVRRHVQNIVVKLGVHARLQDVTHFRPPNLPPPPPASA